MCHYRPIATPPRATVAPMFSVLRGAKTNNFYKAQQLTWVLLITLMLTGCGADFARKEPAVPSKAAPTSRRNETAPMASNWPFKDAENLAVISLKRITDGSKPILYVVHAEVGDWQFLDGGDVSEEDATVVSLREIVEIEPSIGNLADLPSGWTAQRASVDKPWQRFQR